MRVLASLLKILGMLALLLGALPRHALASCEMPCCAPKLQVVAAPVETCCHPAKVSAPPLDAERCACRMQSRPAPLPVVLKASDLNSVHAEWDGVPADRARISIPILASLSALPDRTAVSWTGEPEFRADAARAPPVA
jgi:hypothetical protein